MLLTTENSHKNLFFNLPISTSLCFFQDIKGEMFCKYIHECYSVKTDTENVESIIFHSKLKPRVDTVSTSVSPIYSTITWKSMFCTSSLAILWIIDKELQSINAFIYCMSDVTTCFTYWDIRPLQTEIFCFNVVGTCM